MNQTTWIDAWVESRNLFMWASHVLPMLACHWKLLQRACSLARALFLFSNLKNVYFTLLSGAPMERIPCNPILFKIKAIVPKASVCIATVFFIYEVYAWWRLIKYGFVQKIFLVVVLPYSYLHSLEARRHSPWEKPVLVETDYVWIRLEQNKCGLTRSYQLLLISTSLPVIKPNLLITCFNFRQMRGRVEGAWLIFKWNWRDKSFINNTEYGLSLIQRN